MRQNKLIVAGASLLIFAGSAHAQRVDATRPGPTGRSYGRAPQVEVWIDRYVFRSGERIRAFFDSEPGAYVTILRVTTTGNVAVLYPRRPGAQRPYRAEFANNEVPSASRREFYLNEPEGVGFIFAIASFEPFNYRAFNRGGQWSMLRLAEDGYGDPYRAVNSFVSRTLSPRADYSTDYIQYEVIGGGRYDRYGYDYGYGYGYGVYGASYNDRYYRCLRYYGAHAVSYCHSYAGSGYQDLPYIVLRQPQQQSEKYRPASPPTKAARRPRMPPPDGVIGDPGVEAQAPNAAEPSSSKYSRMREQSSSPRIIENTDNLRIERRQRPERARQDPAPYIIIPRRVDPAPLERHEPQAAPRYEPPAQRYEPPPVQRYEHPRVEQRQESRPEPVAPREHPRPRLETAPPPPPPPPPPGT